MSNSINGFTDYSAISEFYRPIFPNLYQSRAMYCNLPIPTKNSALPIQTTCSFIAPTIYKSKITAVTG
jgi:hypothetical protein